MKFKSYAIGIALVSAGILIGSCSAKGIRNTRNNPGKIPVQRLEENLDPIPKKTYNPKKTTKLEPLDELSVSDFKLESFGDNRYYSEDENCYLIYFIESDKKTGTLYRVPKDMFQKK